jgi:hypothetical protein
MAVPPHGQVPSEPEEALAREMVALLKPVLMELDRKLDSIIHKMEDLRAQLDAGRIHALLARLEAQPGAVQRDDAPELWGSQQPHQEQ